MPTLLERPPAAPVAPAPRPKPARRRELAAWLLVLGLFATGVALGRPDSAKTEWTDFVEAACILGLVLATPIALCSMLVDLTRTVMPSTKLRKGIWLRACAFGVLCSATLNAFDLDPVIGCGGPNEQVRGQLSQIQVALEDYAQAHGGSYPAPEHWILDLTAEPGPLHGHALPRMRWAQAGQTVALAPAALGLPGAGMPGAIANVHLMQALPGGQRPKEAPTRPDDFGAVLYDLDPKTQTYVLYAIGKRYRRAEVVAYVSNVDVDAYRMGPPTS